MKAREKNFGLIRPGITDVLVVARAWAGALIQGEFLGDPRRAGELIIIEEEMAQASDTGVHGTRVRIERRLGRNL